MKTFILTVTHLPTNKQWVSSPNKWEGEEGSKRWELVVVNFSRLGTFCMMQENGRYISFGDEVLKQCVLEVTELDSET